MLFGIVSQGMVPVSPCMSAVNPSGPGLSLVGRLLIAASTSVLVTGLFKFQILPGLGLGGCKCPGIYQFLPGLLVYVHRALCSSI